MAWGNKYVVEFKDYDDNDWDIIIQEDGYTDSTISLTPGATPARLQYHAADKHQAIVGSTLEIQVVYDSNVADLFVEEDQVLRIQLTKGGGSFLWYGYITPFQYYKRMGEIPHYATFLATDQLGLLKNVPFEDDSGDPHYYINDELYWLEKILDNCVLGLELKEAINIYDDSFSDEAATDTPLDQTYIYPEQYWNEVTDERMDCYTALEDILKKYGARICQGNSWLYIQRPNAMWAKHTTRSYSSYTYSSNETAYRTWNRADNSGVWLARPEITKIKRTGRAEVEVNPRRKENLIKNSTFDDFTQSGGVMQYWTYSGSANFTEADGYIDLLAATGYTDYFECLNYPTGAGGIRFVMDFRTTWASATSVDMKFRFTYLGQYYGASGWQAGATDYTYDIYTATGGTSMTADATFTLDFPNVGLRDFSATQFRVRIYELEVDADAPNCHFYVRNARLEPSYKSAYPSTFVYAKENAATSLNTIRETIYSGDAYTTSYDYTNPSIIVEGDQCYYCQNSTSVNAGMDEKYIVGHAASITTKESIQDLLARQLLEATYTPKDIIRGTMRGDYDYTKSLVEDGLTDEKGFPKTFIGQDVIWDIRRKEWNGTWVEVGPVYNTTEDCDAWASENFSGDCTITGNEIVFNSCTIAGPGEVGTFESYTAVVGEHLRFVITLTDDGSSDDPIIKIDGDTQTVAWGVNYIEYYCDSAGAKALTIEGTITETLNLTGTVDFYYCEGL